MRKYIADGLLSTYDKLIVLNFMRLYYQAKNNYEQKKYNKLINYAF